MSQRSLEQFRQELNDNEAMQRKLSAALGKEATAGEEHSADGIDLNVLIDIARQEGYEFTIEEAEEVFAALVGAEGGEADLTDYELELIAGGWGPWRRRSRSSGGGGGGGGSSSGGGGSARSVSTLEI